jgi:hypothetical protein
MENEEWKVFSWKREVIPEEQSLVYDEGQAGGMSRDQFIEVFGMLRLPQENVPRGFDYFNHYIIFQSVNEMQHFITKDVTFMKTSRSKIPILWILELTPGSKKRIKEAIREEEVRKQKQEGRAHTSLSHTEPFEVQTRS